jgi:hypothetical protein
MLDMLQGQLDGVTSLSRAFESISVPDCLGVAVGTPPSGDGATGDAFLDAATEMSALRILRDACVVHLSGSVEQH